MNRQGSLIWWPVCVGLALFWVWNFQPSAESSSDEVAELDLSVEMPPAPLQSAKSFRSFEANESTKLADQILGKMEEAQIALEEIRMVPPPSTEMVSTPNTEPMREIIELPSLDFNTESPSELPDSFDPLGQKSVMRTNSAQSTNQASTSRWQSNTGDAGDDHRIQNPYFNANEPHSNSIEPLDPVLTFESTSTQSTGGVEGSHMQGAELALDSKPVDTGFSGFDDLKQEQMNQQTVRVQPSNQFVTSQQDSIVPLISRGQNLRVDDSTIQQCVNHIEYGKSLARRGAAFAAREEFYNALRLIAQANDTQSRSSNFTNALSEAITALNEADDFYGEIGHEGVDVNVAHVVEAHRSKVIPMERAERMSSVSAIQVYFEFARERMRTAFGQNVVASEALFSLGKLFTVAAKHELTGNPLDYSKSIVMHYAAIDCNPTNYKSSNELGVLMARNGRLDKAGDLFRESLRVQEMPQTWRNLAVVHDRIAQASQDPNIAAQNRELAQMAGREYQDAMQNAPQSTPKVQWVSPEQFEQTAPPEFNEVRTAQAPIGPATDGVQKPAKENFLQRWKKLL